METAAFTAAASVLVAVLIYVLNQRGQVRQELRQARLARVNSQLRDLYGPLHALVEVNERIWESLRAAGLPAKQDRRPGQAQWEDWPLWRDGALMPANTRMRDLIISHADLLIEPEVPAPVQDFCSHVTSFEVLLTGAAKDASNKALIPHPGTAYLDYVRASFALLKAEQHRLLSLTAPR
ncbi:hypothetical protein [Actinomadura chibensis]|uniref:Uncharacterized protein n=1 Tax=Actinomadura chibensis TaxID=392828 RepID=A0A5D0P061_9ACTN|nr:hypothetical protein [Actinomadura chibensis]TYB49798.1 hypothetical protein FXF69_12305 [Actinomadura chibensis]